MNSISKKEFCISMKCSSWFLGTHSWCSAEKKVYWGIKIFPTPGKLACDPNANPNDCPSNRVCQEIDGDGNATCVCDPRFYLTNNDGHCILGKLRQVWDKCKKFSIRKTHL